MADHPCIKEGDIASLKEKVEGVTSRQDRQHDWINDVERDCRNGRGEVEKYVEEKFEKVLEAVGKMRTSAFRSTLTVIVVFASLFGIFFLTNGR